jgi:hypothetical protein
LSKTVFRSISLTSISIKTILIYVQYINTQ